MSQRAYQRYTPEFKEQALGLLSLGKPVADVAQELQISSNLLYAWRSQSQRTQGGSTGLRAVGEQSEADALRALRRENEAFTAQAWVSASEVTFSRPVQTRSANPTISPTWPPPSPGAEPTRKASLCGGTTEDKNIGGAKNGNYPSRMILRLTFLFAAALIAQAADPPFAQVPAEHAGQMSPGRSPLTFNDGRQVTSADEWAQRRAEILADWHAIMGAWPEVIEHPKMEVLESTTRDEGITQRRIRIEIAPGQTGDGYLLLPAKSGKRPAVFVPYYAPESSAGLNDKPLRDFAWQLARRGFVTLCIGSPGGDARKPVLSAGAQCQPLSYLGYVSANMWQALASLPEVDATRIGIVGHSYGGKWSLFGSCLWEKYACAVWSDPGIVFDETRGSINYQEPWYLGLDPAVTRKPGLVSDESPRTGAYKRLIEKGHNLQELHALMAPRPFLVSGGAEDPPKRWAALNHAIAVNQLLGFTGRVAMTNRPDHSPNEESNGQIYRFFEYWLKP